MLVHLSEKKKQLVWLLNSSKGFTKISKPTERDGSHHLRELEKDWADIFQVQFIEIQSIIFMTRDS